MKHSLLPTRSHLHPRGLAITMTWLLLMIFYGLSTEMNTAQAQTRIYVTNPCTQSVSVIDTATNTVIATVTEGVLCPIGIAITPTPLAPTSKDDCKNGGYRRFGPPAGPFRNQGQCRDVMSNALE